MPSLKERAERWLTDYEERDEGGVSASPYELCEEASEVIKDLLRELARKRPDP